MKKILTVIVTGFLSACAVTPINTHISQLNEARTWVKQAHEVGAERCAPEQMAIAEASLFHAAHEYSEGNIHLDEQSDLTSQTIAAAKKAIQLSKGGCKPEVIRLKGVHFATNSAELSSASDAILNHAVAILKRRADIRVEVAAHTDDRASDDYNLALSTRRAQSVMQYLTSHGIAASRLTSHGYGEAKPVADNTTVAGRAKNRRVELRVLDN